MLDIRMYWLEDDEVPFATFLRIIQTYYHPENRHDNCRVSATGSPWW